MQNIAIFASGKGSNAQRITTYFQDSPLARVSLILSNKPDAQVLQRAQILKVPTAVFNRTDFVDTDNVLETLLDHKIDFIVMAGFLWLMPKNIIMAYPAAIVNIHPALLPKYGGKGMYGNAVHKAIISNKEQESGITIHWVNEHYDNGAVIFQEKCSVEGDDTPETLAQKVAVLEQEHYPPVIEACIKQKQQQDATTAI